MVVWIIAALRVLRELSYLVFAPAPDAVKGTWTKTEVKAVKVDTVKAGFNAATLTLIFLLVARLSGVEMSDETAAKLALDIPILWTILVGVASAISRYFHDSDDRPLPTPPPEPLPPPGVVTKEDPRAGVPNPPPPPPAKYPPHSHFFG